MDGDGLGCARCQRSPSQGEACGKTASWAGPVVMGPQTGSSAPGTLGLGVSSGEAALNTAMGLKKKESREVSPPFLYQLPAGPAWELRGERGTK